MALAVICFGGVVRLSEPRSPKVNYIKINYVLLQFSTGLSGILPRLKGGVNRWWHLG